MKPLLATVGAWLFLVSCAIAQDIEKPVRDILFKITATTRNPDFLQPWNKAKPADVSGTGFLIEGNRILTNAHVVCYATQIYAQPDQSDQRIAATVEAIGYTVDLAILKLDDESILDGRKAIPLDDGLPHVRSDVTVYGYPMGGDQLSVTKGIVSRVEYTGTAIPIFTIGFDNDVCASDHAAIETRSECVAQPSAPGERNNMLHTSNSGDFDGAVRAAIVDHLYF